MLMSVTECISVIARLLEITRDYKRLQEMTNLLPVFQSNPRNKQMNVHALAATTSCLHGLF